VPLIKEAEQREWIARKLASAGEIEVVSVLSHAPTYFRKGNRGGKLATVNFDGVLRVSDPTLITKLLENSIGHAKAYGCNLLLVRRL
jgi:CRISPR system Cascade subunit CasE